MAKFQDLPTELYLEILHQCHPRDLLTLITASPTIFRLFQWQRSSIIRRLIKRLFAAVPRPPEALSVARLRLLGDRCKSTQEYEKSVRIRFEHLTEPKWGRAYTYVEEWPSDLPTLAVLADICSELDLLTEKVRVEHWDDMILRAESANHTCQSLGRQIVPPPQSLGAETFFVQSALLHYELYCRLYYHGADTLHLDSREYRKRYQYRPFSAHFLPAVQFVYNIHWNSLLELLSHGRPGGTFAHTLPGIQDEATPRVVPTESALHWLLLSEKAKFLRYLTSFGIQLAAKVSQSSPPQRKSLIESTFSEFNKLATCRPRHCFPQPDPYQTDRGRYYWETVQAEFALDERWQQRAAEDDVYRTRREWCMGPWFDKCGPPSELDDLWKWRDSVWRFEQMRDLADRHDRHMQNKYGK
ncbi:hypothetical protein PG991_010583 [Apiospora marii]|uniref:F-box domain-containing protein n=1 Tax=Apiospora marii TaxID=335849 RepID=A0ABR1RBQ6_9PEZI